MQMRSTQCMVCEIRPKPLELQKSLLQKLFNLRCAMCYTQYLVKCYKSFVFLSMHWARVNAIACSTIPIRKFNFVCAYINTNRHAHTHSFTHCVHCTALCSVYAKRLLYICCVSAVQTLFHSVCSNRYVRKKRTNETNLKLKTNKRANNRMRTEISHSLCIECIGTLSSQWKRKRANKTEEKTRYNLTFR